MTLQILVELESGQDGRVSPDQRSGSCLNLIFTAMIYLGNLLGWLLVIIYFRVVFDL